MTTSAAQTDVVTTAQSSTSSVTRTAPIPAPYVVDVDITGAGVTLVINQRNTTTGAWKQIASITADDLVVVNQTALQTQFSWTITSGTLDAVTIIKT